MPQFSANLGFLWAELPLPEAIRAAARAGFAAVECHWPHDSEIAEVQAALRDTGLPLLALNTARGQAGEFGLSAVPGREAAARAALDEALNYGAALGARFVHVMAGKAQGDAAQHCFEQALRSGAQRAADLGLALLIEPLNRFDVPGYFLRDTQQAVDLIERLDLPNLRLMFDCYHVARTEGDVIGRLKSVWPHIGHIQFAGVPDRGAPDQGWLDYTQVFEVLDEMGWRAPLGAEYRPDGPVEQSLGWMPHG